MARITAAGSSNDRLGRWDAIRLGTSSSTSESQPDRSGTSGMIALPSPALVAESHSSTDQPQRPAYSSVGTTDGSGQETGSSPLSLSGSSEDSVQQKEATPAPDPEADIPSDQLMAMAREAYFSRKFDESDRLLDLAESRGEDPASVASARGYVRSARALAPATPEPPRGGTGAGPSEEDPEAGGMLVP